MTAWLLSLCVAAILTASAGLAEQYFVSPLGDDANPGTLEKPFATLSRAQQAARAGHGDVILRGGTYHLTAPLVFTEQDSGVEMAPRCFSSYHDEKVVLSGACRLEALAWRPCGNGIFRAQVPADLKTEELFVNGEKQILARYPNVSTTAKYFDGFAADALSDERASRWADPTGGYLHAMHPAFWGDFTWRIAGRDAEGRLRLEGGWQNNRGGSAHDQVRFVENIFEELDAPGEWYLDLNSHTLYLYPSPGLDLSNAIVEATLLRSLVEFRGGETHPVKWLTLRGLTFRQSARTVMDNREPLLRSDWTIYRGGALFFDGAEDCLVEDCAVEQVGGNAIFVNNHNRRVVIRGTQVSEAGASGICFVGDPKAARSPLFNYQQVQDLDKIDRTPGPLGNNYPADCRVDNCLIRQTGRVEKQSAGVEIDLARNITVSHCSIYDMPRAGINIGDGCWGGHLIEYCDVFDTVKETGDHGSFNAWGRDRYWRPNVQEVNAWVAQAPDLPLLDAVSPVILRNNRWRCDHGWDIDLDDGASNYLIENNLCLRGGIKNREGFRRIVQNNILVACGYDPHVWYSNSGDIFRRNILWTEYRPANMPPPPWGHEFDLNLVHQGGLTAPVPAAALGRQSGRDEHSVMTDAQFVDPANGDYRVQDGSPARKLGFINFPMDEFGVQKPELRALARTPQLPQVQTILFSCEDRDATPTTWFGAMVRNIRNQGEMSAYGLPDLRGLLVLEVPKESALSGTGLRKGDVILSVNGHAMPETWSLATQAFSSPDHPGLQLGISRDQQQITLQFTPPSSQP